jgi:peptidoglycan/LPS O-acetylase OafA/YrhL
VAVAGVLLFHGGRLAGGFLGVEMFFVLSGFLITSLLLVEGSGTGRIRLGRFWARRARRLLPALVLLLLGTGLYCIVFASPDELADIRGDALATLGYVANWRAIFSGHDYWSLFAAPSPLQHTWSLAIEEQFYLVWPLVFVGLVAWFGRHLATATFVVAVAGSVVSAVLFAWLYDPLDVSRVYYGTDTRAGAVLLGGALAATAVRWGPVPRGVARVTLEVVAFGSVALLAWAWSQLDGQSPFLYRGGFTLCALAVVVMIASITHPERGPLARVLAWRPLCLLGLISYGVYLWHWPVYLVVDEARSGLEGWALLAVRVAVTVVIATASYLLVEQPIRRGAGSGRTWAVAAPAIAVGVVVVVVTATVGARSPPNRRPEQLASMVRRANSAAPHTERTLVVGDSLGFHLGIAMNAVAPASVQVFNLAHTACVFPSGAQMEEFSGLDRVREDPIPCDANWDREQELLRPHDVVFSFWAPGDARYKYGGYWLEPCDAAYDQMYRSRLEAAVRRFRDAGARASLTTNAYTQYDRERREDRERVDCVNRIVRDVARQTGARVIDLFDFVCPQAPECRDEIDGQVLRPDYVHYSDRGGELVARWVFTQLDRPA